LSVVAQERVVTRVEDEEGTLFVALRPLGVFWGVFTEHAEEPLSVGRTPLIARVNASKALRRKLRDIRAVVRQEGRATMLYRRLGRTLRAVEGLGE
jgi:hypothetical protein